MTTVASYPSLPTAITLLDFHRASTRLQSREQEGIEFFKAYFIDKGVVPKNCTRPLVVKKKRSGRFVAGNISPLVRKRRSTISSPRSPLTPRTMAFDRLTNTAANSPPSSTSSFNPHHSIATTFLNQSLTPLRSERIASTSSDLHLNLGQIKAYDEAVKPGPSPPTSPQPSPIRRNFGIAAKSPRQRSSPRASVIIPKRALEPPMTPSRAPSKAAALLGVDKDRRSPAGQKSSKKRPTHFRPLPTALALEIDLFFGDVPKKKRSATRSRTTSRKGTSTLERGAGESTSTDKAQSERINHVGEDGSLWMDVEEEQEFAWLLSDLPQHRRVSELVIITGEEEDDEEMWGMKAFTSVLDMPKPKPESKSIALSEPAEVEPITPPKQVSHLQPFLGIDPYASTLSPKDTPAKATASSISTASPSQCELLSSSPPSSDDGSPSRSPKSKRRPPPLTLRGKPSTTRLPVLAVAETPRDRIKEACPRPSKPSISQPRPKTAHQAPSTPFIRPRTAPAPAPVPVPTHLPVAEAALQTSPTPSDQSQPRSFFDAPSPVGGFRVSIAKKMKWGIAKVVNTKTPKA